MPDKWTKRDIFHPERSPYKGRPHPACPTCNGKKTIDKWTGNDKEGRPIVVTIPCPDCNGSGKAR